MPIFIELKDGRTLLNDPALGLNLGTVEDVQECFVDARYYYSALSGGRIERIDSEDVACIYEAPTPRRNSPMDKPLTDEELNIAVAEKVMGWRVKRVEVLRYRNDCYVDAQPTGRYRLWAYPPDGGCFLCPDFAHDGRGFMYYLVDAMAKRGWTFFSIQEIRPSEFLAGWGGHHKEEFDYGNTRLRAACLAAVKAVESEVEHG